MGLVGVRSPAVRLPGACSELHATVVTIASVDLPVATALAFGDAVPHARLRRLGRFRIREPNPTGQSKRRAHADGALDDGQLRNESFPEYACGAPGSGRISGPALTRC
jgi:hypothetical protein